MARVGEIDFELDGFGEEIVRELTMDLHGKLQTYKAASRGGIGTPVDSGDLIRNWQMRMDSPSQGRVFNNLVYAEPVITGENLPESWGGQYRTRQGTQQNYHESILEEVMDQSLPKIIKDVRRRRR